jgi:hypothetical protein
VINKIFSVEHYSGSLGIPVSVLAAFRSFLLVGLMSVCPSQVFAQSAADTLLNFNSLLGGARRIAMPREQELPEGLSLHSEGLLLGPDSLLFKQTSPLSFKVETGNGDVYEIQVQARRRGARTFLVIQTDRIEMATGWRKEGKIWVVVVVSLIVFAAIVAFLLYLERRLSRLEKGSSV